MRINFCKLIQLILIVMLVHNVKIQAQVFNWSPNYFVSLDSAKGERILHQCSRNPLPDHEKVFELKEHQLNQLRKNFGLVYNIDTDKDPTSLGKPYKNLKTYAYQAIGVRINGVDFIYLSAFEISFLGFNGVDINYQLREPVIMCDGGASFWGVLYDLQNNKFQTFQFNGNSN